MANSIIIFDGECGFCNRILLYLAKKDIGNEFLFVSNLSTKGKELIAENQLKTITKHSIVILSDGKILARGTAVKLIINKISAFRPLRFITCLPTFLVDVCYRTVAKNRYFWGKNNCKIPSPFIRAKFIM